MIFRSWPGGKIIVRRAKSGEQFQAIDHKTYTLDPEMCVIADAEQAGRHRRRDGRRRYAKSRPTTTDVLIEAAQFAPLSIRSTARKLKLHSPSSYRFERGTDPEMVDWASRRACELILKHAGGELVEGVIDVGAPRPRRPAITLRLAQLKRIIGIDIPPEAVRKILIALGCLEQSAERDRDHHDSAELAARSGARDRSGRGSRPHSRLRQDSRRRQRADGRVAPARQRPRAGQSAAGAHGRRLRRSDDRQCRARAWSDAFSPWTDAPPLVANTPMLEGADRLRRSLVPSLLDVRRINESLSNPAIELFETARIYLASRRATCRASS